MNVRGGRRQRQRRWRERKRHVQQELFNKSETGRARKRRRGARPVGRPPGKRRAAAHKKRPAFPSRYPLHVVLTVEDELRGLRKAKIYKALRRAVVVAGMAKLVRIVHISIQQTHVHLLVEASGKDALSRGMQGFQISAAKHINRAFERRRGQVFSDRYHSEIIKTPNQARHALAYVLNNWRKHQEDRWDGSLVDPFSSGWLFDGWKGDDHYLLEPRDFDDEGPLVTDTPRTWLLSTGWRRRGRIDFYEVPSARVGARACATR